MCHVNNQNFLVVLFLLYVYSTSLFLSSRGLTQLFICKDCLVDSWLRVVNQYVNVYVKIEKRED